MILRQAAFQKNMPFLKGGLHCHTTLSDGKGSPEATVRHHAHMGYDFLAITDHRRYNFTNFAPDTGLLIIPGMEADRFLDGSGMQVVHAVALGPENGNGYTDGQTVLYERGGLARECQDIFDDIRKANNLAVLAHPTWSGNTPEDVLALQDYQMIEIWNTGSEFDWGISDRGYHWDVLLSAGRRVWGVASDDGHALQENGFGFVRVAAEKNVASILEALKNGEFYASCGPEIYDFYIEDGWACIHCSPVDQVAVRNFTAPHRVVQKNGMTAAQIKIRDCCQDYIRMEIVDAQGRRAWTNPIFL